MAHILVVDNEPSGLAVLVTMVEKLGHRCLRARDREEGIALFKAQTELPTRYRFGRRIQTATRSKNKDR